MTEGSIKLILPPQWTPQNPPFALYSVGGHLRSCGISVSLIDLNLMFYESILSSNHLNYTRELALLRRSHLASKSFFSLATHDSSDQFKVEAAHLLELDRYFEMNKDLLKNEAPLKEDPWNAAASLIDEALATMRDPERFYNPMSLVNALIVIDETLRLASLPFFPAKISLNDYRNPLCRLNVSDIAFYTKDRKTNMFIDFYEETIPELFPNPPDKFPQEVPEIIAISINAFSQVIPGLTLARMLKERFGDSCHLCIGGNFFGRLKDALMKREEFFQLFCDSLVLGEGEETMVALVQAVQDGSSLETVPRILYWDKEAKVVRDTPDQKRLPLEEIGFLDLEGLPLGRYLTPHLVICIQYSRGCYWGKCTFCDAYYGVQFNKKSLDRFTSEVSYLKNKYGIAHFEFIDECIRPIEMKEIAQRFKEENLNIHWFTNARTELQFTPDVFDSLREGGLTMLLWGIESGSRRIMQLIQKGVGLPDRLKILENAKNAGLWNFAYIFFGFPSETKEEAMETIQMICNNTNIIHSYGRSIFTLGKHSPLRKSAKRFGIVDLVEDDQALSTNLFYKVTSGMNQEEVENIAKACTTICYEAYNSPLWMYLRNRENLHLYLAKHGADFVANFKLKQTDAKDLIEFQK